MTRMRRRRQITAILALLGLLFGAGSLVAAFAVALR